MVLTYNKIYFNITQPGWLVYNFGPEFNRYTILTNTPVIFSGTSLPSAFAMLQVIIDLLVTFISRFITVFTVSDPMIYPIGAYWAFTRFLSNDAYDFRAPLVLRKQLNGLIFHIIRKLKNFWIGKVPVISFTLGNVSAQFLANGRRMNSDFLSNHFLFHSSLNKKGVNLIPLYQTEVSVIFCHLFLKIVLIS